jgi:hypothetical protein
MNLAFASEVGAEVVEGLRSLLATEPIIEVISDPHYAEASDQKGGQKDYTKSFYGAQIYLVTELGTLVGLWYDFRRQAVINIKTSDFLKKLVCYKIKRL